MGIGGVTSRASILRAKIARRISNMAWAFAASGLFTVPTSKVVHPTASDLEDMHLFPEALGVTVGI